MTLKRYLPGLHSRVAAIAPAVLVAVADVARAAEGHGEGGGDNLFAGDLGNAVWTILIFVLVLVVLGKFAWGPILKVLQQREDFIRDSLESARKDREEAERVLKEYSQKIEQSRQEATAIVDEGRRDAEEVRKRIHAEARSEAQAITDRAKKEIQMARDDAIKKLHDETVELATRIASKIVQKELSPADHERLLDESLAELSKVN